MQTSTKASSPYSHVELLPVNVGYQHFLNAYFRADERVGCGEECAAHICALMHFFEPKCAGEDACMRCSDTFLRMKIDKFVSFVDAHDRGDAILFAQTLGDPDHAQGAVAAAEQFILWSRILDRLGEAP